MVRFAVPVLAFAAIGLAGCGTGDFDRAVSGGGIGAATGAIVGALTPVGPGVGALVGAGLGGTTGAATEPSQIDLGKPVWEGGRQ